MNKKSPDTAAIDDESKSAMNIAVGRKIEGRLALLWYGVSGVFVSLAATAFISAANDTTAVKNSNGVVIDSASTDIGILKKLGGVLALFGTAAGIGIGTRHAFRRTDIDQGTVSGFEGVYGQFDERALKILNRNERLKIFKANNPDLTPEEATTKLAAYEARKRAEFATNKTIKRIQPEYVYVEGRGLIKNPELG